MGELGAILSSILEIGLAPVLVILLLWKGFDILRRFERTLYEVVIGIQIMLTKLDVIDEYKEAVRKLKEREHE